MDGYDVIVHSSTTGTPFATMHRGEEFRHYKDWTEEEKTIATKAIAKTLELLPDVPEVGLQSVRF